MKYKLLTPAAFEIEEAAYYYDTKEAGLGSALLNEYDKSIELICNFPYAWPIISEENQRRCLIERFPYGIIYKIIND
jgi:hypothetical protein